MARSLFPEPHRSGERPSLRSASAAAPSSRHEGGIRWLFPTLILGCAGVAMAIVFGVLWWHSESRTAHAEESRDMALAELDRVNGDQARQGRVLARARISTDEQLGITRREAQDLRRRLAKAEADLTETRTALDEAGRRGQELLAEIDSHVNDSRQRDTLLEAERARSGVLTQNPAQAEADYSGRASTHDQDLEDLQENVADLRNEVTVRDIEVTNVISRAEREISSSRQEAQRLQVETSSLTAQLSTATSENDRLCTRISGLESELSSAKA
ncbi:MAG: hypothetical protein EOP86_13090, partial [Verrucomicrobiaceae bacterium]